MSDDRWRNLLTRHFLPILFCFMWNYNRLKSESQKFRSYIDNKTRACKGKPRGWCCGVRRKVVFLRHWHSPTPPCQFMPSCSASNPAAYKWLRKTAKDGQVLGTLPPVRETWIKFLAVDLNLTLAEVPSEE